MLLRYPDNPDTWNRFITTLNDQSVDALTIEQYLRIGDPAPSYNSGTGIWAGIDSGTAKLFVGDDSGNKITWDGSTLTIVGNLVGSFVGDSGSASTVTPTFTGFSSTKPDVIFSFSQNGGLGVMRVVKGSGAAYNTSNSTSFGFTGLSSVANPLNTVWSQPFIAVDNNTYVLAVLELSTGGVGTFHMFNGTTFDFAGWTNSGDKGLVPNSDIIFDRPAWLWA